VKRIRIILGSLLLFIALNALGGGWYGMAGAKDVPVAWLQGSLFSSYFIPGFILFVFIGINFLAAAVAVFKNSRHATHYAFCCAAILFVWIVVQVSIIGWVSWLQPAMAIAAILIFLLALRLYRAGTAPQSHHT
jgi:Ca2+/Na+ antiporter